MSGSVVVAGARTPIGKLSGALGSFSATELGGFAIAAALDAIDRAAAGGKTAVDEDLALHRAIAAATGNTEFPRFLQFIGRHLIPRRTVSGLPEQMGGRRAYLALIQEEHRRICQAIERRDPRGAREAMRRHLTRSLERYRRLAAQRKAA